MLGRLRMSVDDAISAYCQLMSETYSRKKPIGGGDVQNLRAIRLKQGLEAIVEKASGNADEGMMEENPNEAKCKVQVLTTERTCFSYSNIFSHTVQFLLRLTMISRPALHMHSGPTLLTPT